MRLAPIVLSGSVSPSDQLTQKLLAFDVPPLTTSIHVCYSYSGKEDGNGIDLGLLGVDKQFRGYSGGARSEFTVANDEATPGYIAGLLAPGEWYVLLGIYNITTPTATYKVEIILDDAPRPEFCADPAPARADFSAAIRRPPGQKPELTWLKGDFHTHTLYSDGKFTLDELADKALRRGLDFIFSSEHNTYSASLAWGRHVPEGFLVGRAIEVTTLGGHWNALGLLPHQLIDPQVDNINDRQGMDASLVAAVREVHKSDGFAVINHPFAECKCCGWSFSFHDHMDGIEVWNGPWKRHAVDESNEKAVDKWDALLREGKFFTASGGSDIHEPRFEIAEPVTRVLADEVSVNAIIRGLRARRVYLTQHPAFEIDFSLSHGDDRAGIGDWLETDEEVTACVAVKGFPEHELRLITEAGLICKTTRASVTTQVKARYVRVEVRDLAGSMLGLTNPIWVLSPRRRS